MKHLTQRNIQIALTSIVLFSLVQYGFFHVAPTFARYTEHWQSAYFMAFGFELAVFSLSLAIGLRTKTGGSVGFFWAVLVISLAVTTIANVYEAWLVSGLNLPNGTTYGAMALFGVEVVVLLVLNLSIPFVTMSMAELLGDHYNQLVKTKKQQEKKEAARENIQNYGQDDADRREEIFKIYQRAALNGSKSPTQIELKTMFDVSQSAIVQDINWLVDENKLIKNGRGYKIVEVAKI